MSAELQHLQKQVAWMRWYILLTSGILISLVLFAFTNPGQSFGIIRAKGIIIEDSVGRDRILIGSPIPFSKDRVRNDTNMVRKYWAKRFGNGHQYMEWYKNYYHGAEGIVVMNEQGFDRVLLGDKLADPNTGKRMFQSSGILWNDKEGWELGGAGVNTTEDGKSRSVMGVDDKDGEAVHIVALEDDTKGLIIGGANGRLMIGMSKKDGQWFQNKQAFTGIKYFDNKGKLIWEQAMDTVVNK
ncbi:MAG: hypothetical protein HYI21_15610 [Sediminibacterium sp. Gen4]|jgi:hypothetical protein|uniref:hypothetical protein n=1 Tax=unclassified Sediminibacterium TaxID=2635961 RepID=UPI0015BC8C31|nr:MULTISPECIES: hypothetical protein [unclassified Sediminibacterium]MBW0160679.1 hypothetical protein [Sediminibacterium sp.]MBW0163412.1 hypothetical protein [Sediminibacterium sp.]NWK67452.1 hypothetical protein [Sediminibacterium sp. Gen4]